MRFYLLIAALINIMITLTANLNQFLHLSLIIFAYLLLCYLTRNLSLKTFLTDLKNVELAMKNFLTLRTLFLKKLQFLVKLEEHFASCS